jgi:sulfur-oxidizing protein SoxA
MRFPRLKRPLAAALAFSACASFGNAELARQEMASRLESQLPGMPAAEYALGTAAFDPEMRARIAENAAASSAVLDEGRKLVLRKFRNGRSIAACFPNGGRRVAATYPQYHARLKRVVTLEMAINQCLKSHGEALLDASDPRTMGAATAYLRSLANGQKIAIRVPAAAEDRFAQGKRLYFTRLGQRNFACASCHVQGAGRVYADIALSPPVGQATRWPLIRDGNAVTLQAQIRECLERMGAAPFAPGSDELNHLEYFITYLSQGLPIRANEWRPKSGSDSHIGTR